MLAVSLLTTGENYKSLELFQVAAKGIFTDEFLAQRVLNDVQDNNQLKAYVNYYLKVLKKLNTETIIFTKYVFS